MPDKFSHEDIDRKYEETLAAIEAQRNQTPMSPMQQLLQAAKPKPEQ